jgi:3-oxoacyl-[acyl-carrier protein] reductase
MLFGEICTHRMETGLQNRVAIVAASSKEIGRATALAAESTKLALCERNGDLLNQVAEEVRNPHGVEVYTDTLDVAEDDRMGQFVEIVAAGQPSFIIALLPCS